MADEPVQIVRINGSTRVVPTWALLSLTGTILIGAGAWAADLKSDVRTNTRSNERNDVAIEKIGDRLDVIEKSVLKLVAIAEERERREKAGR